MLQEIMDKSGKSTQSVVEEALVAYYESEYGSLVSLEAPIEVEVVEKSWALLLLLKFGSNFYSIIVL